MKILETKSVDNCNHVIELIRNDNNMYDVSFYFNDEDGTCIDYDRREFTDLSKAQAHFDKYKQG